MKILVKNAGKAVALIMLLFPFTTVFGQNIPCPFNSQTLQFQGSPKEQARCLLRPVKQRGILGETLKKLPAPLEKLIGEKIKIKKENLRKFLVKNNISETSIGGSLDEKLSTGKLPDGTVSQANYFIIHDVSAPNYLLEPFPANINDVNWTGNNLANREKMKVAHVFVNRAGQSVSAVEFGSVLPEKRFGTKFARDNLKAEAKGLQIHVELVQPRRSDFTWFKGNDAIAPEPGFTDLQYEGLALLYVAASIRRGNWLIPAFHCAIDAGIPDAHDDPQNFSLDSYAQKLQLLVKELK
jgi:hypothetical protein